MLLLLLLTGAHWALLGTATAGHSEVSCLIRVKCRHSARHTASSSQHLPSHSPHTLLIAACVRSLKCCPTE